MKPSSFLLAASFELAANSNDEELLESLSRRAASAAYYAAFHAIVEGTLNAVLTWKNEAANDKARLARKFTHRIVRDVCARLKQQKPKDPVVFEFYDAFIMLYGERHLADYDLFTTYSTASAEGCVIQASLILNLISNPNPPAELRAFYRELFITHFGKTGA